MSLPLRFKILGTYVLVFLLFAALVLYNLQKMQHIDSELRLIEEGYIPMVSLVGSISHLGLLSDDFDPRKLLANAGNPTFVESIRQAYLQRIDATITAINQLLNDKIFKQKILGPEPGDPSGARRNQPIPAHRSPDVQLAGLLVAIHQLSVAHQGLRESIERAWKQSQSFSKLGSTEEITSKRDQLRQAVRNISSRLSIAIQQQVSRISRLERHGTFLTMVISVIGSLLVLMLSALVLYILKPIQQLTVGVQRISQGDMSHRVQLSSRDEVGILAAEFNKMADSLERLIQNERLAAIGKLSAQITHEIRNPLNALSLNMALLREDIAAQLKPATRELFELLEREIKRLNQVSEHYLQFVRPTMRMREPQPILIQHVIEEVCELMQRDLKRLNIALKQEIAADLPPVKLDANALKQALLNLIQNAKEAMLGQGGELIVGARRQGQELIIEVIDSGSGIAEADLGKLFNTFFTTKPKGTGLGLALTQKLIEEQNGRISYERLRPQGMTFRLHFRLEPAGKELSHAA